MGWRETIARLFQQDGSGNVADDIAEVAARTIALPEDAVIYAVGDVHGRLDLLERLSASIATDAAGRGEATIVQVGDMIDRGLQSAQIIDMAMAGTSPLPAIWLMGNHEQMMLDFLDGGGEQWLRQGGIETLISYGAPEPLLLGASLDTGKVRQAAQAYVPASHVEFLRSRPLMVTAGRFVVSHAGIDPRRPLAAQREDDVLWFRDRFGQSFEGIGRTVVHGHQPIDEPLVTENRIAIDTGAYFSGRLTAVRLMAGEAPYLLQVDATRPA